VKERPDQIQFLCGRLRFELTKRRIPLGWLVVLVEIAASSAARLGGSRSLGDASLQRATTQQKIWRELSGYRTDGMRRSSET
jgi:hypothetical protein